MGDKFHVVDTPCWPAHWKCESIAHPGSDNSTYLYHRTYEEAQQQVDQFNQAAEEREAQENSSDNDKPAEGESKINRCIRIWKPEDFPDPLRELVGELDDANWIALVPHSMKDENLGFLLHSSMFDSLQEPATYMTTFGIFIVGVHA